MRKENIKKYKINVIDILVILLALVCITSIAWRSVSIKEAEKIYGNQEYRLYFQIDNIKSSSYSFFDGHSGETVRMKDGGAILGALGSEFVRGIAIHTYTESEDGNQTEHKHYYPESTNDSVYSADRCSISGYIVISGKLTDKGFLLNGNIPLAPNQILDVVTEHIETSIEIIDIVEK